LRPSGGVQASRNSAPGVPPEAAPIELQIEQSSIPPQPPPSRGGSRGKSRRARRRAQQHGRTAWAQLAELREMPAECPTALAACIAAGVSQAGGWHVVREMGWPSFRRGDHGLARAGERVSTVRRLFLAGFTDAALELGVAELGEPGAWV
jgi:hypothetical protein